MSDDSSADGSEWVREHAGRLSLLRPASWEWQEHPKTAMVLAHPPVPPDHFRPNLVLRVADAGGASVQALATSALAASLQTYDEIHVIAHEEAVSQFADETVIGRKQKLVYQAGGQSVCVDRWLWVLGADAVELTASYALEDLVGMEPLVGYLQSQLNIHPENSADEDQDRPTDNGSVREPKVDEFMQRVTGRSLEDLSRISAAQHYASQGPVVNMDTVRFLESIADRGRAGRFEVSGNAEAISELVLAGLATGDGQLTASGRLLAVPWKECVFGFTAGAQSENLRTSLQVWIGGGMAAVAAGPPPLTDNVAGITEDNVQLDLLTVAQLPMMLAQWFGLGPAWTVQGACNELASELFHARLGSAAIPPPVGADAALERMWAEPWMAWSVRSAARPEGHSWLRAGATGNYRVSAGTGGTFLVEPEAAGSVWDHLVRFIHEGLVAIPEA